MIQVVLEIWHRRHYFQGYRQGPQYTAGGESCGGQVP